MSRLETNGTISIDLLYFKIRCPTPHLKHKKGKKHFILQMSNIPSSFTCRYCLYIRYIKNSIGNYLTLASICSKYFVESRNMSTGYKTRQLSSTCERVNPRPVPKYTFQYAKELLKRVTGR